MDLVALLAIQVLYAVASLALISVGLAIIFGIVGLNQISKSGGEAGGKGMAIWGLVCGGVGLLIRVFMWM